MLKVAGIELETRWTSPPDGGPVLVFLHEGLGSISQWRETPDAIAAAVGRPGFVYARQGYGTSTPVEVPRPLSYMHDEAALLPVVLAAAKIEDAVLVGHSDGASIAIIAAGERYLEPRALVLIAPHVFVEDVSVESIERAREVYLTGDLRARLARHHADVDGAFWGWNRAWLDPAFRRWNLEEFLPRVKAPALVVQGERDEYGTAAQVDAIARQSGGPVEVAWIPDAGHAPFRDAPALTHARIVEFVRRQLQSPARSS